ncbi:uncharacterized protein MELLADRAFT_101909 [Melampsora larici-populina 98AG31]|uniref:C2H2-type domain-containing protein n=1 Tax=Melampsora larici-populina (strain 98AG31 / pathotype 3-4-7) TaxID=747676 RepID=F4R5B4_MELLP|nr:uncharacterized protein MELLADRAFT_101909 [Melampsora larici-populina 98AG31]EGG12291.1 hypothetical protein MELLADRAFT_101909 [Melampsora larici-populina 98AG31]
MTQMSHIPFTESKTSQPPTERTIIRPSDEMHARKNTIPPPMENGRKKPSTVQTIRLTFSEENEQQSQNKQQEFRDQENEIIERLIQISFAKQKNGYKCCFLNLQPLSSTPALPLPLKLIDMDHQGSLKRTHMTHKSGPKDTNLINTSCGHHHHYEFLSDKPNTKISTVLNSRKVPIAPLASNPHLSLTNQVTRSRTQSPYIIHEVDYYQDNRRNFLIAKALQHQSLNYNQNLNYNLTIRSSCQICFQCFYTLDLLYRHISSVHSRHSKSNYTYFT